MWKKHRITTRLLSIALVWGYVYSVQQDKAIPEIVSTTGWLVFLALVVLTFGLNSIEKITELVKAWRAKK
jgi:uncharacterized membrane protein YbjE (DUF340 family)